MAAAITIELCAEDRARFDRIISLLTGKAETFAVPQAEPMKAAEPDMVPTDEAPPAEFVKTPTLRELQEKVVTLSAISKSMKDEVRTIIKSYAPRVQELPEDKFGEIWAKLARLEG